MANVAIFGAGKIGTAVAGLLSRRKSSASTAQLAAMSRHDALLSTPYIVDDPLSNCETFMIDKRVADEVDILADIELLDDVGIAGVLQNYDIKYVINALPFFFNEKIARAAVLAGCHYIDFTEDDGASDAVQKIYSSTNLSCATKCGLAPGFINYVGMELASAVDNPSKLMICVGALPVNVNYYHGNPEDSYKLSWSVDGLVNEYIKPCRVRIGGVEKEISALTGDETVLIDGFQYEAAFTAGGVGSLIKDLKHVPNVYYKTLRYPGHYDYVKEAVQRHHGNFSAIKKEFLSKFAFDDDVVVVVYAECVGKPRADGTVVRKTFASKFYGNQEHSAIQLTTAGGGLAALELMVSGQIHGIINHKDIPYQSFINTETYKFTYNRRGML